MKNTLIKTDKLSMKFGKKIIFNNVNIEIDKGETVAFVGENGTGKSTMLKIMGGLLRPSGGKVIMGSSLKLRYIPERFDKINFTIPEFIYFIGRIDGLSIDEIETVTKELYQMFFLNDMLRTPMKFLSKGTLQKVAVIQALLIQPDVLLLDEPLSGQDYLSQKKFIEKMLELKKRGVTILISCHEQFIIEQLADRVLKIEKANFKEVSTFHDKTSLLYNMMLFNNSSNSSSVLKKIESSIGIHTVTEKDNMIHIIIKKENCQELLLKMLQEGFSLVRYEEI